MTAKPKSGNSALSALPSIDDLLRSNAAARLINEAGRSRLTELARVVVSKLRHDLQNGSPNSLTTKADLLEEAESRLTASWQKSLSLGLRRVINATGVVIHTNLGRAPLSAEAIKAIVDAAGYCNVEYDVTTGERGKRGARVEAMIRELTGAEDALVV